MFGQLFFGNFCHVSATLSNFSCFSCYQNLPKSADFGIFLAAFDCSHKLLATFINFLSLKSTFGYFFLAILPMLAIFWQFLPMLATFWQSLAIFGNFGNFCLQCYYITMSSSHVITLSSFHLFIFSSCHLSV